MSKREKKSAAKPSAMPQRIRELQVENARFIASQSEVKKYAEVERQFFKHNMNRSLRDLKISELNISNINLARGSLSPRRSIGSKAKSVASSSSFAISRMLKMEDQLHHRGRGSSVDTARSRGSSFHPQQTMTFSPRGHEEKLGDVQVSIAGRPSHKGAELKVPSLQPLSPPSSLQQVNIPNDIIDARPLALLDKIVVSRSMPSVLPPCVVMNRPKTSSVTEAFMGLDPLLGDISLPTSEVESGMNSLKLSRHTELPEKLAPRQVLTPALYQKVGHSQGEEAWSPVTQRQRPFQKSAPLKRKRTRILAEKLCEVEFIKDFFNNKAPLKEAQSLVKNFEEILYLLDQDLSGFVPWDSFMKVMLSIAPRRVRRQDVLTFLDSQCEDSMNLIDYREFVIVAKLNIVKRYLAEDLPVAAWIERQKVYTGEPATYTWKNHIQWFIQRRTETVIWLMRRATRAVVQHVYKGAADVFLQQQGKIAQAYTYLREVGWEAMMTDRRRREAKRRLVARCTHAKKSNQQKDLAFRYLTFKANGANILYVKTVEQAERLLARVHKRTGDQANYNLIYALHFFQTDACGWLRRRADEALAFRARQDDAMAVLSQLALCVKTQMDRQDEVAEGLIATGEWARDYCCEIDRSYAFLARYGEHARRHATNKENAFALLVAKGKTAIKYEAEYWNEYDWLAAKGRWALNYVNSRKKALGYLQLRQKLANVLIVRKKEALMFLRRIPRMVFARQPFVDEAQHILKKRANRAKKFLDRKDNAFRFLKHCGKKAAVTRRKMASAQLFLQQKGKLSKFKAFVDLYLPGVLVKLEEEKKRVVGKDKKVNELRDMQYTLVEQRWHAELEDAFDWMDMMCPVPKSGNRELKAISWFGFQRLMLNGALLNIKPQQLAEDFKVLNTDRSGLITFSEVWEYFLPKARRCDVMGKAGDSGYDSPRRGNLPLRRAIISMATYGASSPSKHSSKHLSKHSSKHSSKLPEPRSSKILSSLSSKSQKSPYATPPSDSKLARIPAGLRLWRRRDRNFTTRKGYRFFLDDIFSVRDRAVITLLTRFLNPQNQGKKASEMGNMNMMMYGGLGKRKLKPISADDEDD